MRLSIVFIAITISFSAVSFAQDDAEYGKILSSGGKTVTVQFDRQNITVGDEVEFWRFKTIVDPTNGIERGTTRTLIGKGVIDEIGLGKANVTITELTGSSKVMKTDRALPTGVKKRMTRKVGRIQEIAADKKEMVIDLGSEDEVSEGDDFLIQRTENIYDPETKKVTGTNQVDIGRGKVSSVRNRTSTASITAMEPGREILTTDTVVFTEQPKHLPVDSAEAGQLRKEIEQLKSEITTLKSTVDSLGANQLFHYEEFLAFKREIESLASGMLNMDARADKIMISRAETVLKKSGEDGLAVTYRRALDDCLKGRLSQAETGFQTVMDRYPDSRFVENCRYWIAQCRFASKDYAAAASGFQSVIDDTRFAHKDDDAALMLGLSYFQTGRIQEAILQLQRFLETYEKSEYREKVEQWIERMSMIKSRG